MDNILKLLLGVLGLSGMITMVTSNLTFEPQSQSQSQPQSQSQTPMLPPPDLVQSNDEEANEGEEIIPDDEVTEASEEDGDDIFAVGEPMIDGNPYGTNSQTQAQSDRPMIPDVAPSGGNNFSQAAPQSYDQQQYYAPQPAQAAYAPAFTEGQ